MYAMPKNVFSMVLIFAVMMAGGCAPANHNFTEEGAFDPVEPINRAVYGFNKKADFFVLRPAATVYGKVTGPKGRRAADNFFSNLGEPKNIVNHVLQKRGNDAARSTARFVFNSIFGLGGLADVAEKMGVEERKTDFGQTIRAYAGNRGAYIVLPFLGPSSVADAPGAAADGIASPQSYLPGAAGAGVTAAEAVHLRHEFLDDEHLLEAALDEYTYVRDIAEERRRTQTPSGDVWGEPDNVWQK